jgi:glucose dehydrogenase
VYFAYPSGEVFALLEETGAVIWDAMLAKFSITNASNAFSHPRACPVVKGGIVYFVGANEQTNAFDIKTGKLLWRSDYGGVQTPVLSGDNIFVFSSKSELVCLNARTGKQRWATSLETDSNLIADWYGMTLIKDHILMVAPGGRLIYVSAYDGKIKNVVTIDGSGDGISVNPVIADGVLYLLLNSGQIVAYR